MTSIWSRLYIDYLAPRRLDEFAELIRFTLRRGYVHKTLHEFHRLVDAGHPMQGQKIFLHRHDVDTAPGTARMMFEIEKEHRIRSTYYFRLSTIDIELMRAIDDYGSEVGYHFEEVASYCKRRNITTPAGARAAMPEIRQCFIDNFKTLEDRFGRKIRSVSAHGDFANRKLGIKNFVLLTPDIRHELKIDFEDYDARVRGRYNITISDASVRRAEYRPTSPFDAIEAGHDVIHLLSHPRYWRSTPMASLAVDGRRLYEAVKWELARRITK